MEEILKLRSKLLKVVREFFELQGFIEVETPLMVPYENPDSNVVNVKVSFSDFSGKKFNWFLHTSPEFFMKRIIWHGIPRIYQISKVFRDGEITESHNVEFTMVEWYRTGADYKKGMEETLELLKECVKAAKKEELSYRGKKAYLHGYISFTVEEAFREFAGVKDIFDEEEVLKVSKEKEYESGFFKLLVDKVEPALAEFQVPVFLYNYPSKFSAMAKVKGNYAERFELYVCGLELANGYTELTDFESYKKKFFEKGKQAVDKGFLKLLKEKPLPPCEGVALGFDRVLMLITGKEIHEVIPFSLRKLVKED
ncbi:amino acid--tRNA ligase-related protein [Desulfurobacterium thermolithotrophum]|uniref:amino acid--tRNA ligase-related protein n=1 Tax=Desulfurobacterium thermolithotrophum TaxID=64160 RepID=UPI0013CFC2C4|nr:amino acid--tRNA ligase-related protein [Desulfurobacterium thermolithotrophum]